MVRGVLGTLRRRPRAYAGAAMVVAALALATAGAAHADTARVRIAKRDGADYPTRIVITTAAGVTRTLGPFRLRARTSDLLASPDGRYVVLVPEVSSNSTGLTVVSLEDGTSTAVRAPDGITILPALPMLSWAPDRSKLVLHHAVVGGPDSDPAQWSVLRCAAPDFACRLVDDGSGAAAAIPGGIVTGSTLLSVFPSGRSLNALAAINDGDHRFRRRSRTARELRRLADTPVESRITTLVDGQPRTVRTTRRPLRQGLPVTAAIVGGASGALLTQEVYRMTVRSHSDGIGARLRVTQRRLVRVTADGTVRTTLVPQLTIPRAEAARDPITGRRRAERLPVAPKLGLPSGGWLATVGTEPSMDEALALARIDADGTARFVRSRGRIVSAASLAAGVRAGIEREPAGLEVVGHERATDAAIVVVRWWEPGRRRPASATFRVPLDEQTPPTLLSRLAVGAAW